MSPWAVAEMYRSDAPKREPFADGGLADGLVEF
jgi:hypothetical protein